MKKIFLIFFMIAYCISCYAQSLSGPSSATDGATITITGSGESNSSYINCPPSLNLAATTTSAPNNNSQNLVSANVVQYTQSYNTVTHDPTKFTLKVNNVTSYAITATFYFNSCYSANGTYVSVVLPFTITINPTTAPPQPTTYYNVAKSGSFTKNNCSQASGIGTTVTYTVPAHTYASTTSQADADQQAQNDVNTNGQAYANANGSCTPCFPQISSSTIDGVAFSYGTAISIGYHTLVVNCSANPQITFTSYSGNNIQISQQYYGNGTGTCNFYYSGGSAAIRVTEVTQCYNRFEQISFSQK